jgi:hypothetical protein
MEVNGQQAADELPMMMMNDDDVDDGINDV